MSEIANNVYPMISLSVVSHGQMLLISNLFADIASHCSDDSIEVLLTLNINEDLLFDPVALSFPVIVIRNATPKGFGANHNQAFAQSSGAFFCVVNPDIRFGKSPFSTLINALNEKSVGVAAPTVVAADGKLEDSARQFPSPLRILCKALGKCKELDYPISVVPFYPDWVGGMFLAFRKNVYAEMRGFDEKFFLYYEDVDLCGRLTLAHYRILVSPVVTVVHDAQRTSHRSMKFLRWHATSMLRFFCSSVFVRLQFRKSRTWYQLK